MIRIMLAGLLLGAAPAPQRDHTPPIQGSWRPYPGQWVPGEDDVRRAHAILAAWFATPDLRGAGPYSYGAWDKAAIAKTLPDYDFQFVGVRFLGDGTKGRYAADGARGVLIRGVPTARVASFGIDLDRQEFLVADGGNDLFQALVNLDTGKVEWFMVNGVA